MEFPFQNISKEAFFTKECLYRKKTNSEPLVIGIPKENHATEPRLPFTPEGVEILINAGYEVIIESGAGDGINYSDQNFSEVGAFITESKALVYQADIVFKVTALSVEEASLLKEKATLFSMLQLSFLCPESIKVLQQKKITAIAYDFLKDENKNYSVVNSICEIEGNVAISVASELMSNQHGGKGILLGGIAGISPTEVVILGAGLAGTAAARVAFSLGCYVKVFDYNVNKLRVLQRFVGSSVFTSVFHPLTLSKALLTADAVIGCMNYVGGQRYLVSEDAVRTMKKGAVIVDIAVDQGGCFETSVCSSFNNPFYVQYGVIHYCIPNISARVARTASMALSNVLAVLMVEVNNNGGILNSIKRNQGFCSGVYLYNGILTNAHVSSHLNLPYNDIRLLLAAF
jgi:alanine dehydrogenase